MTYDQIQLLFRVLAAEKLACEVGDDEYDIKMFNIRDQIVEKLQKRG